MKVRLPAREIVAGADAREDAVDQADLRAGGGDVSCPSAPSA